MGDDAVKCLLKSWNMEHLIPIFEEHEITKECMDYLTDSQIAELIPKIGIRVIFVRHLTEYRSKIMMIDSMDKQTAVAELLDDAIEYTNTASASSNSNHHLKRSYEKASFSLEHVYGQEEIKKTFTISHNLNLREFLNLTATGQYVLREFDKENRLNGKTRSLLVEVIINAMLSDKFVFTYRPSDSLKDSDFQIVAENICKTFPNETEHTYYIPRVTTKCGSKTVYTNAKGKLVDKYRNWKHLFKSKVIENENESNQNESNENESAELLESADWLKKWSEPKHVVVEKWNASFNLRKANKKRIMQQFLDDWPILLNNSFTEELINLDFQKLYSDCKINLLQSHVIWEIFFIKLKSFKRYGNEDEKDRLISAIKDSGSEDAKNAIQFASLPTLIPPKEIIKISKKPFKPSIIECRDSLIVLIRVPGDIEVSIKKRIDRIRKLGLSVQPYVIVVGSDWVTISDFYVVIDNNIIKCGTVLGAIDLLFKIFQVCNVQYPLQSEHIWLLIQKYIYNIDTKWDKNIPYISTLLQELRN